MAAAVDLTPRSAELDWRVRLRQGLGSRTLRRLVRNRLFTTGAIIMAVIVLLALCADLIATADPTRMHFRHRFTPPGDPVFLLGTDNFGRDLLARLLYGARVSLRIGLAVVLITGVFGTLIGALAGYFDRLDNPLMRVMDALMAFPAILLAIAIAATLGPSERNAVIALAIVYTPRTARIVRASVLVVREMDYVQAIRAAGARHRRILFRHILPNAMAPLIVQLTFIFAYAVLAEAILSFIGVGPPPPAPTWGNIIAEGRGYIREAFWITLLPGIAISITVLGLNLLGDGLRDVLDPAHEGGEHVTPLLAIRDLTVEFPGDEGWFAAVDRVSLEVGEGEFVGVVGESGSGKSVTALAAMRLIDPPARIAGAIAFAGRDLVALPEREMRRVRGKDMAMIFQEPMSSLNPVFTVGEQIAEVVRLHERAPPRDAMGRALAMLRQVGIPDPGRRLGSYPHELSGGMRQRVMIAMALACRPKLLIADEPTTALDVTIQAQVLELLSDLRERLGLAVLLITHDLGVVAEHVDRVVVMYAGRVVETAPTEALFGQPMHPYTRGLLDSIPKLDQDQDELPAIAGTVPIPTCLPPGCRFEPRCGFRRAICSLAEPPLSPRGSGRASACILAPGDLA